MTGQELAAVATAAPTPYVHDVVTACQNSGRSVSVVSNNSARAVHAYLARHGLDDRISSRDRTDQPRPRPAQAQPAPDHPGSRGTRCRARGMHARRRFRDRHPGRPPRQRPQHRLRQQTRQTRTPGRSRGRRHHQQPRRPGSQTPRTGSQSSRSCDNFLYAFKGAPAARQPWPGHGQDQAVEHATSPRRVA